MPSYRDVSQLTIRSLVDPGDRPETIAENETIQAVATKLAAKGSPQTVVVVDAERKAVGVVSTSDVASAISQGLTLESSVRELTQRKPPVVTVPDSALLEQIPMLVGSYSTVIITDPDGRPAAAIDREVLAERVKTRFTPTA